MAKDDAAEQTKKQVSPNEYYDRKIVVIKNGISEIKFLDKGLAREKILVNDHVPPTGIFTP